MAEQVKKRILGPGSPLIYQNKYRHMMPIDTEIWKAFLKFEPNFFELVWYDLHLGKAMGLPEGSGDVEDQTAQGVSRKRVDVVGLKEDVYWIIEIKAVANMEALGQIQAYSRMFRNEFEIHKNIRGACLCWKADQDLVDDYWQMGITVISLEGYVGSFR